MFRFHIEWQKTKKRKKKNLATFFKRFSSWAVTIHQNCSKLPYSLSNKNKIHVQKYTHSMITFWILFQTPHFHSFLSKWPMTEFSSLLESFNKHSWETSQECLQHVLLLCYRVLNWHDKCSRRKGEWEKSWRGVGHAWRKYIPVMVTSQTWIWP